ncbi:MAG: radical SAM family heme chaperone HemW [Phycisphaerales bacterium]|nr:radical SAM family heme chaperone HemW [Phycisphaerales bacterium]
MPTVGGSPVGAGISARGALAVEHEPAASLYIHVPFCFHKCHYCDFYSFVDSQDRQAAFVAALEKELSALAPHAGPLRTIFVGGGTPSLLRVELWERLLASLGRTFELSAIRGGRGEFTVECNPETVTPELMRTLRAGGVDRVSVGAQSFHERHLKTLERWHDPANVQKALSLAADAGILRRSVDLIYGIPGQSMDEWRRDVETALALRPGVEHLSCYALTYEANTAMTMRLKQGEFTPCDEDLEADMYEWLVERLRAEGFDRYEVSNFARPGGPGAESRHNLAYWKQESWLAAGPSASGHLRCADPGKGGVRWKNVPRLTDWMEGVERSGGFSPAVDVEMPDPSRARRERIMMGLRLREGLAESELAGLDAAIEAERAIGLVKVSAGRVTLTDRGFLHADGVARRLMGAI